MEHALRAYHRNPSSERWDEQKAMYGEIAAHRFQEILVVARYLVKRAKEEGKLEARYTYKLGGDYGGDWIPWYREPDQLLPELVAERIKRNKWLQAHHAEAVEEPHNYTNGDGEERTSYSYDLVLRWSAEDSPTESPAVSDAEVRPQVRARPTLDPSKLRKSVSEKRAESIAKAEAEAPRIARKKAEFDAMCAEVARHRLRALLVLVKYEMMWLVEDEKPLELDVVAEYRAREFSMRSPAPPVSLREGMDNAFVALLETASTSDPRLRALGAEYEVSTAVQSGVVYSYHSLLFRGPEAQGEDLASAR